MAITATISFTNPFAGTCPSGNYMDNVTTAIQNNLAVNITQDSSGPAITHVGGSATPSVANNKIWYRVDNDPVTPKPLGEYIAYNGRWVPVSIPPIGTIRAWTGDPTGLFDSDGKGLFVPSPNTPGIAGAFYGWQITNGNNGSRNLKNAFLIAAEKYDAANNNPVASIPQQDGSNQFQVSGGRTGTTLLLDWLPNLQGHEYNSGSTAASNSLYAGNKWDGAAVNVNPRTAGGVQVEIKDNYPLFRAVFYLQFQGYEN